MSGPSLKILLTGASGFIGRAVHPQLAARGHEVRCAGRSAVVPDALPSYVQVGEIDGDTRWRDALQGVDVVVHLAGRAHVFGQAAGLQSFDDVNVKGSINFATQAAAAGVRRFVFISSIGVNGVESLRPFTEADAPNPSEPYAASKLSAERSLFAIAGSSGMELVVIRPPLVYGRGAPGNFGKLVNAVRRGIPLPLGAVRNRRTLVGRENLADLIACCVDHPAATNEIFLAGDAQDLSTTELLRLVGTNLNRPARLVSVPVPVLEGMAALVGRRQTVRKLCGDLLVDTSKARALLGWHPPFTVEEGLRRAVGGPSE